MTTRSRRVLIVTASLLIVAVAGFVAWSRTSPQPRVSASSLHSAGTVSAPAPSTAPSPRTSTPPSPSVRTPVPVSPSASASRTPAQPGPAAVHAPALARVEVVTTVAGWNGLAGAVVVGGYAAVVEPVGTCTLRLSHAGTVVTHKHVASADATTVACGGFSVPRGELSTGDWQAVLGYTSPRSAGQSAAVTVKVP